MDSILEGELAETIGEALLDADIPIDVTITRETPGNGPPYDPGPSTFTPYACKGFVDEFADSYVQGGLVQQGDVKVVVVATSLSITPTTADTVTVRGKTYAIINVSSDPALALWELQARA